MKSPTTIVIGSLNIDLIATGVDHFPDQPGRHVFGNELSIGPGGKSRNIADMASRLMSKGSVAMVGRTVRDPYGLWKIPINALNDAGVRTEYVNIREYEEVQKLPGMTFIPIDKHGNSRTFILPGISNDLSTADIDRAIPLFKQVGEAGGIVILTCECPVGVAIHAIHLAKKNGIKIFFDPGGIESGVDVDRVIDAGVDLIKPNQYEAEVLTGIKVRNLATARQAAQRLHQRDIKEVLITAGSEGAYLFTNDEQAHIPIPQIPAGNEKDGTGCGDQTIATLSALIQERSSLIEAARLAVAAGTLQFHRLGVKPLEREELMGYS